MPVDASHFSMVGYPIEMTEAGLSRAAEAFVSKCTPNQLSDQDVVCSVVDASGAEVRLALRKAGNGQAELVTINPGFSGDGRVSIVVDTDVSDPAEKPFEITLTAHFSNEQTPLVFDLADPAEASKLTPGSRATIDLAAFSFEPTVYRDEAAFRKSQDGEKVVFAANAFIPTGLFLKSVGGMMSDGDKRPVGYADFVGTIVKAELRTNQIGQAKFWRVLVKTHADATVDVVLDPSTVHGDLRAGEILSGRFWLSAHLAPQDPPASSSH